MSCSTMDMPSLMSFPQTDFIPRGFTLELMANRSLPTACSVDRGAFPHQQHYQNRPMIPADPHLQVSMSQDELRRLLDAADYAHRERAFLLQALEGLSVSEKPATPSQPQLCDDGADAKSPHVLMRDEGGLFRLVSSDHLPSTAADCRGVQSTHCLLLPAEDSGEDLDSDHFRMFRFKVQLCRESRCHDWAQCPFAHPGEKAARRDPRLYRYSAVPCPDVKRSGKCARGDACTMAHGVFECWLHPSRYRTQPCKDGVRCPRKVCFFAHSNLELRLAPAAAAAAAADAVETAKPQPDPAASPLPPSALSLHRRSFDIASCKESSPSSVLSPFSSSPPGSPPLRTSSLPMSDYPPQFTQYNVDYLHCSPPRFAQHQLKHRAPQLYAVPVPQQAHNVDTPMGQPVNNIPVHGQPGGCSAGRVGQCHVQGSSWVPADRPWPYGQISCAAPLPCEDEPDLSWVCDLIQ